MHSCIILLLFLSEMSFGMSPDYYYMHKQYLPRIQKRIIVDVNPGIEDIQGLVMLIDDDNKGYLKIEAVLVSEGKVPQKIAIKNTLRILEAADRLDIPVYKGSKNPLLPPTENFTIFGKDSLGDLNWRKEPPTFLIKKDIVGPQVIKDLVLRYPREISIITLGPLTNLALALRLYEDVARNIKDIFTMGGITAEANILFDPEAAQMVFESLQCPMYLLTYEGCSTNSPLRIWFENATIGNPVFDMMLASERSISKMVNQSEWLSCQAATVSVFLERNIVLKEMSSPLRVHLDRDGSRGTVEKEESGDKKLVTVIEEINYDRMLRMFLDSFHDICYYHNCQKVF